MKHREFGDSRGWPECHVEIGAPTLSRSILRAVRTGGRTIIQRLAKCLSFEHFGHDIRLSHGFRLGSSDETGVVAPRERSVAARLERQREREGCSLRRRLGPHASAVRFHDSPRDVESEPRSLSF
jgi:hypothetical protein